ncbi:DUF4382 domain-containing protein [Oryzomonas japonica]|uniref:DUF4382 domain-containing protein n=1 Tax=Oryzomonas japonica TaxID=2603858 RepID=A0A7J4ZVE0_9BACT|nr:DUF4382 domain-containing protein [Oryzomonas japonica]KAB0667588.1 DUF4382 domain-containing protein [Oryzomonas japonica]
MNKNFLTCIVSSVLLVAAFLGLGQMQGCSGDGSTSANTGTLQVGITDSPAFPNLDSVHLTIDKVVVVPIGKEGLADNDPGLPVIATFPGGIGVDILNLHFLPQILGTTAIPAGSYSQVRLILAPNSPTLNNYVTLSANPAQKLPLTTPSAQESGLKIKGNFTVTAGALNTIVLDFNPNEAIVFAGNSGNINLKPTGVRIIQVFNALTNAGSLSGTIRSPQFTPWSSATVTVVPRTPAGGAVTSGVVFSNFSSPSVWKSNFSAFVPPNNSAVMLSAHYRVFVRAFRDTLSTVPTFNLYSSPLLTVTGGADTAVPPNGLVQLGP